MTIQHIPDTMADTSSKTISDVMSATPFSLSILTANLLENFRKRIRIASSLRPYGAVDEEDVLNWFVNDRLRTLTCVLRLFLRYVGVERAVYVCSDRPARNTLTARICAGVSGRIGCEALPEPFVKGVTTLVPGGLGGLAIAELKARFSMSSAIGVGGFTAAAADG